MQQIPMTSPPAVGYPAADPQWLHRQQQISRMAHQVHHAHQERAATPWAMNPYALNQSKFLNTKRSPCNKISSGPLCQLTRKNTTADSTTRVQRDSRTKSICQWTIHYLSVIEFLD